MIELGRMQKLEVKRITSVGVFLNVENSKRADADVLLPKKEVPENTEIGDTIEVFIYRDFQDRLIATVRRPKVVLGEIGLLKV